MKLIVAIQKTYERAIGIHRESGTQLDGTYLDLITIGDNFIGSIGSRIICHDASYSNREGNKKSYPTMGVNIGYNVFLGANSLVLMGCKIGNNVVIGAGSVVSPFTVIPNNEVWAGVPAKFICTVEDYIEKLEFRISGNSTEKEII